MRFSSTSLALLVGTTLVTASSPASGGAAPDLIARASQPEHNISERDLLERAHKFIRANRRRGHGHDAGARNGPRRMEAREHGKQPAIEARAVEAEEQLQKKDDLPLLVDAQLLGKPLAVVDGTVNLGNEGLKGVLGGLNLGGLLGKREKEEKKEKAAVTVEADVLDKNLADVDAKVDLNALNAENLKKLLDADINVNLARRTEEKRATALPINVNTDLLGKPLADVQAAVDLNKLAKVNVDVTANAPSTVPAKETTKDPKEGNALVDADVKADVLDANKPLAVVDAKIDLNAEKLAKVADADLQLNLLHTRSEDSDSNIEKKSTLPLVVDADLLGKPLADVDGAVKLDLEKLTNVLDADLDVKALHKRHEPSTEQTVVVDAGLLDHPVVDAKIKLNEHLNNLKVGGLTLATLKKRADQLALAVNEHLTGDHAYEDCGLGDVEDALTSLFTGVDHAVFRRKL
ncbi:hypothetical protein BCR35DRAFT_329007 [Leucosporidium creatinivorum]|uniref:Uncharacterized protein n=1 Tax=Leucosporidium creatinivorum TaxID=106004 RepID=A0A1Y2FZR6_9BASI|nr:hypothetical protein BCR35DRAFT_329007 [Leucosporidium creatinivorum]